MAVKQFEETKEFNDLMAYASDKSKFTQKAYRIQYKKLHDALKGNTVKQTSQEDLILVIKSIAPSPNTQQAVLNIAILIYKIYELPADKLIALRDENKEAITENTKEKNTKLTETLPKYEDLIEYLEHLYSQRNWLDYIINYLLIHFQVRNQDLVLQIVPKKKDMVDDHENYLWLSKTQVVFVRGHYKTNNIYDSKIATITDKLFLNAVRKYYNKGDKTTLVPNPDNVGYYIKKATYKQLGEGAYMKIIVNSNLGSLQKLKEISENRGTSLETIATNYDVELQ